jgi:hypothetical protein
MRSGDLHKVFGGGSSEFFNLIAHLSILFEDLRIENAGVLAPDDSLGDMDTLQRNYRRLYFIRRSLVTLSEVAACVKAIAANSEFRERKVTSRALYLQDVDDANKYFSKKIDLINQFRNEFGGHLDQRAISRALAILAAGTPGTIGREKTSIGNFILQNHYAAPILQAAVLSKLRPGIDLDQELDAVLRIIAEAINYTQKATQALVYGFLWERFG